MPDYASALDNAIGQFGTVGVLSASTAVITLAMVAYYAMQDNALADAKPSPE